MKNLMNTYPKIFFLSLCVLALTACSSHKKKTDPYKDFEGKEPHALFVDGERELADGNYGGALKNFNAIETLYPFSQDAEQAKLDSVYAHYRHDELPETVTAAKQFLHLYPRSKHADYAYYMKGIASFETSHGVLAEFLPIDIAARDLSNERAAFEDFSELLVRYPNSQYAPDAKKRMIYLRNMLAKQELSIAHYYLDRGAYVAAANRASYIIDHFNQAPQIVDALALLVKAYRLLELPDLAEQTMKILAENYPQSHQYLKLKKSA
jgi:outer membrane protein assembly factor BamD